jgi:hypothetical protein
MILSYLRMQPGCQHIEAVEIAPRQNAQHNWILVGTEPALYTAADDQARNAILTLQSEFRLAP